ncbi:LysR family transcriptional regulator [Caldimonas brevitalea]|uniref:LysR family transcriptional regulator n=1 Tax=Caldimonas brevitalea TaxID=413882 RepID=A0A0G3BDQ7_9BURK|nr:LysR family transcriptional regulator [Caldimonas brevitalea]AKJ27422.1 LysR family transcriptional regulator [Caldimonas brevitalea]
MNARTQDRRGLPAHRLSAADVEVVLAVVRGGTLAEAGTRLGVDTSTVFRAVQRLEKDLGQRLFERSRSGYRPTEPALALARHGERIEAELEAARHVAQLEPGAVTGQVRIATTDTVLHGLVLPALADLAAAHPGLSFELSASNELVSLTKRDADIAVRATKRPPEHLVGKQVGLLQVALFAPRHLRARSLEAVLAAGTPWIAPDDALPEHPSVRWRRQHCPKLQPRFKVNSILAVLEAVGAGLGVGIVPLFLAAGRREVRQISEPLEDAQTSLWVLTHPESRHLRRVSTVFSHLCAALWPA